MSFITIDTKVDGTDAAVRKFGVAKERVWPQLRATLKDVGDKLQANMQSAAPHKSGRLSRAVRSRLRETEDSMTLTTGPNRRGYYGKFLEKGVDATFAVKAYTRRNRAADVKGKVVNEKTGKLRRKTVAQGVTFVRAVAAKHMRIAARPWARPVYASMETEIYNRVAAAVNKPLKEE